jgi:hypothetical protein
MTSYSAYYPIRIGFASGGGRSSGSGRASAGGGNNSPGVNQQTADDVAGITGGFSTIFGTATQYSGYLKAAGRIGLVGNLATGAAYGNAVVSGQAKPSHHLDAGITAVLTAGALFPATAPIAIPLGLIYGEGRLVGGAAFDNWFNSQFTPVLTPNKIGR